MTTAATPAGSAAALTAGPSAVLPAGFSATPGRADGGTARLGVSERSGSSAGMRAVARIVAVADGGTTRLAVLRGEVPLLPRRTLSPGPGMTVHLVGGAAGPLGGDDLRVEIEVRPGADLCVRSVAAAVALPGPRPSYYTVHASVAAGGRLHWAPEPLIAAAGCDHHAVTVVDVADGGVVRWRDDIVRGRHGEESGTVRTDTTVRYAGRTMHRHTLSVGPGTGSAAILGRHRVFRSELVVNAGNPCTPYAAPGVTVMPLAGPATLTYALDRPLPTGP